APRSRDRGRRDNYRQGSKVEEQAPKELMAIDGVGWDWKLLKKEKGELETKLTGFQTASKDIDSLLESQRLDKNKEGLGYNVVPPPPAQIYSPPKKDMSWTELPECADDTVIDYSRPAPTIESFPDDAQNEILLLLRLKHHLVPFHLNLSLKNFPLVAQNFPLLIWERRETPLRPQRVGFGSLVKTQLTKGSSQNNINDKGYWDSGCSRHMTGNISYLFNYEPFDGGYVSFGQGGCKITGKGTIKTECIVLGRNFKLSDDVNVLLRTPRQHNMYSIDLSNIVPHKDLTCLVAKASTDECMLWHRRLCHLNFKTMNRLVRHNLVRGLPSKCFENDHSCTACLKGKQHKAS
nr:ribonuclease H-like domain-containing protein [Tanacetum cinerariifolium]